MVLFPNAKINIGLNIIGRRNDGYHNLQTIFYPIQLCDILEVIPTYAATKSIVLHNSGIEVDGDVESNLVSKAYRLLAADFSLPPVEVWLHKIIPFGAGLGGGSSDCTSMLVALNNLFNLNMSDSTLTNYASQLGADCPFFVYNTPLYAEGIGNIFTPVSCSLKGYFMVLVKPNIAVPTAKAFSLIVPQAPLTPLCDLIQLPINQWNGQIQNDFEKSVFSYYPQIATIKQQLYDCGAIYASMSGSGSSVYGIFETTPTLPPDFENHFIWQGACSI